MRRDSAGGLLAGYLRLQDTLPWYRWSPLLSNHDGTRTMTVLRGDVARARLAATLLLTLPGLPFVYYGEEIGMTGDKPDPRIRTPMQWSAGPGAGFTTGTPWESPQPDAPTTTVAAQDHDPGSLLNLYRRLIHLRAGNTALATGRLVPLTTGDPRVVAYLRRDGDHAVLVVANLGAAPASGVAIGSGAGALAAGAYAARDLLTGSHAGALVAGADGRFAGYVPAATIGPRESLVLELARR